MQYLYFAIAGLLVGGVIAMFQQKRPWWLRIVLGVLVVVFMWAGMNEVGS